MIANLPPVLNLNQSILKLGRFIGDLRSDLSSFIAPCNQQHTYVK